MEAYSAGALLYYSEDKSFRYQVVTFNSVSGEAPCNEKSDIESLVRTINDNSMTDMPAVDICFVMDKDGVIVWEDEDSKTWVDPILNVMSPYDGQESGALDFGKAIT